MILSILLLSDGQFVVQTSVGCACLVLIAIQSATIPRNAQSVSAPRSKSYDRKALKPRPAASICLFASGTLIPSNVSKRT